MPELMSTQTIVIKHSDNGAGFINEPSLYALSWRTRHQDVFMLNPVSNTDL
jgi:hypothetical protein